MRLRRILLLLSVLTFFSATAGGTLYYTALRRAALQQAEREVVSKIEWIRNGLGHLIAEHQNAVRTLAGMPDLQDFLLTRTPEALERANRMLDHFTETQSAEVCYLMDRNGLTLASSNRAAEDSFVGDNFGFRPYFQQALMGSHGLYLALGTTSQRRGVYHSYPVFGDPHQSPIGAAVIKSSIDRAERALGLSEEDILLVTDPNGVIFIASRPEWLFQSTWPLGADQLARIKKERQFGPGPFQWIGFSRQAEQVIDEAGRRYLLHQVPLGLFEGWQILHLRDLGLIAQSVSGPLLRIVGPLVLVLSILVGIAVLILFRKASLEIQGRLKAEQALRQSEMRYRSLYHHTPAMLHSVDPQGRLLSVSDYWVQTMGYSREEVLGRLLTDFLTPESRSFALETVMPRFFATGTCREIPYRFIQKNGRIIDVLLSAIADRDDKGQISRSLAVSIDVSARIQAEKELLAAKEELSRYSRELESQVRERTSEIGAILTYTPAVVYIKDAQGRYLMVNSRFEELFGFGGAEVRGRTDHDLFASAEAEQFHANDLRVLSENRPLNVEEVVRLPDGEHIYLSVKFPIYTDGRIRGICGISTDITAFKKVQEQLRRLSGSIMVNQEKERAVIARELHDELGQLLTALRMEAVWLQRRLKASDLKGAERAGAMCALIDTTIEEVRAMAIRLRPGVLDDLGLVDALEWYTAEFERRAQIACIFTHDEIPAVDETVATAAYRIAQEALTNVARHAAAGRAEVNLKLVGQKLILLVNDDGRGFDSSKLSEVQTLGLAGMRERAMLVGGELVVESQPGQGTLVRLQIPLSETIEMRGAA
jgi:PAS domain S-box-containing protein